MDSPAYVDVRATCTRCGQYPIKYVVYGCGCGDIECPKCESRAQLFTCPGNLMMPVNGGIIIWGSVIETPSQHHDN